jgi:hypothetical protein
MTDPTTAKERSRINAQILNQEQNLIHKPLSRNASITDTEMDDETTIPAAPNTVIFKNDPYNNRIDKLLCTFLKPYATSLAKIHRALDRKQESLEQLELHQANHTFPDNITIKNKFIEDIDAVGQTVIYNTILTNRITIHQTKITELHQTIATVRQDCANVIQAIPELSQFQITAELIDKRLITESELIILEYNFKESRDQKQKALKKAKHLEMKAELDVETTVSKGEKIHFANSIKTLENKLSNLAKQLNSRRSHQKGAMRPKKQTTKAKKSNQSSKRMKQTKKPKPNNTKKPKKPKGKTRRGKPKRG